MTSRSATFTEGRGLRAWRRRTGRARLALLARPGSSRGASNPSRIALAFEGSRSGSPYRRWLCWSCTACIRRAQMLDVDGHVLGKPSDASTGTDAPAKRHRHGGGEEPVRRPPGDVSRSPSQYSRSPEATVPVTHAAVASARWLPCRACHPWGTLVPRLRSMLAFARFGTSGA
jgi:hypothetical protein